MSIESFPTNLDPLILRKRWILWLVRNKTPTEIRDEWDHLMKLGDRLTRLHPLRPLFGERQQ